MIEAKYIGLEKIDTSGLNPVELARFWELAKSWGLRAAKEYRKICLSPHEEARVKPLGTKKIGEITVRNRLRSILKAKSKDNLFLPKEGAELLDRSTKAIAAELGALYNNGETNRVILNLGSRKIRYGYWGINETTTATAHPTLPAKQNILNFLKGGERTEAAAIVKGLNLTKQTVYKELTILCEEKLVKRTPKSPGKITLYWIAEVRDEAD